MKSFLTLPKSSGFHPPLNPVSSGVGCGLRGGGWGRVADATYVSVCSRVPRRGARGQAPQSGRRGTQWPPGRTRTQAAPAQGPKVRLLPFTGF